MTDAPAAPDLLMLDVDECRRRLAEGGVGRIALATDGAPTIRPVNFALYQGAIVVRTGEGSLIRAAERGAGASFEIDQIDLHEHTGWSVVVEGKMGLAPEDEALHRLPLRAWASGVKDRHVCLSMDAISGLVIPPGRGNR